MSRGLGDVYKRQVMHQPNEYMKVDDLINSIAIYAEAIYELTK